jgi:hypothetical protein
MGLEEFQGGRSSTGSSSGTGSQTSDESLNRGRYNWHTKLDFGAPYVLIVKDQIGDVYTHMGDVAVLEDRDDFRRLDDHPSKEFRVLYRCASKSAWLRFCNRAQDQLDTDPREVFEDQPEQLEQLRERTYFPPGSKPDTTRTCRLCGASSDDNDVAMLDIDLQKHRHVPVCSSHTIEDLAHEGLLD